MTTPPQSSRSCSLATIVIQGEWPFSSWKCGCLAISSEVFERRPVVTEGTRLLAVRKSSTARLDLSSAVRVLSVNSRRLCQQQPRARRPRSRNSRELSVRLGRCHHPRRATNQKVGCSSSLSAWRCPRWHPYRLPPATRPFPAPGRWARVSAWCVPGVYGQDHHPSPSHRRRDGGRGSSPLRVSGVKWCGARSARDS